MRNWNPEGSNTVLFPFLSLPDYLWGIETSTSQSLLPSRLLRFQTTYEELKHRIFVCFLPKATCFQTTYEELKLSFLVNNSENTIASRLPMRNWNPPIHGRNSSLEPLPDYLWGIETCPICEGLATADLLPDYLWGIETIIALCIWKRCSCFQTTYEELKLDEGLWMGKSLGELPDYLWGIETIIPISSFIGIW